MKKEDIHLDDITRILFGQAPPEFLLEVLVRSIIMYIALVTMVRLLGKRTNAMLTATERAVFITLGALVSQPMQGPPNGIVLGIIALAVMLLCQRMLTLTFFKSQKWQETAQGKVHTIVKDSVIDIKEMHRMNMTRNQLFEVLRNKKIRHLGQVKRLYFEACGIMSVYHTTEIVPGLSILRTKESEEMVRKDDNIKVCDQCGNPKGSDQSNPSCPNCGNNQWTSPSKEFVTDEKK